MLNFEQLGLSGKSLDSYLNQTLRTVVSDSEPPQPSALASDSTDGLSNDDPFFAALEEIRATGRLPATHREVNFH